MAYILRAAIERLSRAGIENASLDARLLAGHALNLDRAQLLSQSQRILTDAEIAAIAALVARRLRHESVARITGSREFWSLNFSLNEATLEPRPDSETIVEAVLSSSRRKPESRTAAPAAEESGELKILDLGAGTGCLLLSLLHEMPGATGIGVDIAPRAVEQAAKNAAALGLADRAAFLTGNWFEAITPQSFPSPRGEGREEGRAEAAAFDIIVSNPPYIAASDIPALMPEVRDYDPRAALDGGADGLAAYRFLIPQLKDYLTPQGIAAFEVGRGQAQQVADLFRRSGFTNIAAHRDLGGIERCVCVRLTE